MSALTRNRAFPDTVPTDVMVEYYVQRALSAGIIASEGTLISPQGSQWPYAPGLWSKEQVQGWKKVTEGVHQVGGKIFAQLWHVGRIANNEMPEQKKAGKPVQGVSAIAARGGEGVFTAYGLDKSVGYSIPTPIQDPMTVIEEFRHAALNAKEAGFDGVELHSANGYLINQFLDSAANKREDKWGGSIENRARFGLEVTKALIDVWGPGRVGVKVSPGGGYNDVGMPLQENIDTYSYYLKEIVAMEVAYVTLVQYRAATDTVFDGVKRGTDHDILATYGPIIKASNGKTSLLLNKGLTPTTAEALLASGQIDAAVFGMAWIANPDLQTRVEKGLPINTKYNFPGFYYWTGDDVQVGYTDYPKAE